MTCTHISQARIKVNSLIASLNNTSSRVYEKFGPYVYPSDIKTELDSDGIIFKDYTARSRWTNNYKQIVRKDAVEEILDQVEKNLYACNCYESESTRRSDLINYHQEERRSIQSQIENIRGSYERLIDDQKTLLKEEKQQSLIIRGKNSELQRALGLSEAQVQQLEVRLAEKTNDLNQNRQMLERLRQAFQDLAVSEATRRTEARVVGESLHWTRGQLSESNNKIRDKENKLEEKQQRLEEIQNNLTETRLERGELANELERSKALIRNLESTSKESQEKYLKKILELLQEKMEELVEEYPITLKELDNLRIYCELLSEARKNRDDYEINDNERKIIEFKQLLSEKGIRIRNIQSLCRECEKVAQIRFELGIGAKKSSSQQRNTSSSAQNSPNFNSNNSYNNSYTSKKSNRNWKNINSNFTPELQREWEKCGFSYEECANRININSPNLQTQAIHQAQYYAWLRDEVKVDSEWVLNCCEDEQDLKESYQEWLNQQQFQANEEVSPRH